MQADADPTLEISSLVDVCFLLLIYFIATTTLVREHDIPVELPARERLGVMPVIEPMFIRVDAQGVIYTGVRAGEQMLDLDPDSRDLPLLLSQLTLYSAAARSAGSMPMVQLYVEPEARQQRVIDVLNALAGTGISSVAFTDLLES